jgi:ABC-type dipeptide/oligopeptide/nickel transport system permease subunit
VSASASSPASSLQASNAFASAGAAAPDEFYDLYAMDLEAEGQWARARRRFMRHRLAVVSLLILTIVFAAAFLAGHLAPYGYEAVNIDALSSSPSWAHPFGTDQVGRDYFSRTLYGLRTEAEIALVIGFFGTLMGTLAGAVSGYLGGFVDLVVMRFADLLLTVPPLVTILVAATFLHTDTLFKLSLLIAAVLWMPVARVIRSTTLVLREQEYVQAARAVGASDARILGRHILPNAIGSVAVAASVMTATAVLYETTLSYLGLGLNAYYGGRTDTRRPSVGDVLAAASNEGLFHWWGIVFPGLVIILIVAPIYFIGDGLRDAFDPTQRRYVTERELARRRRGPSRLVRLGRAFPRPNVSVRVSMPRLLLDALPRSRRRSERSRVRFLLEAVVVLAVTAGAAAGVYAWKVNPVSSVWEAAAVGMQNVSRAPGAQTEIAVASSQRTGVLLAASNDSLLRTIRVYTSTDAGRTWSSATGPLLGPQACARGEPTATIDGRGREYVAFIVNGFCTDDDPYPYLVAAARPDPSARWTVRRVARAPFGESWDDKPALAAAEDGTVYLAWSRLQRWASETIVVSSSRDGGRTWSQPTSVHPRLSYPRLVSATAVGGTLYVTGIDARFGVWLARSRDGARTFRLVRAARLPGNQAATCASAGKHPTPFSATRCLGPDPSVAATADRVYVTYGVGGVGEPQSVHVVTFDRRLHVISRSAPAASPDDGDRFWPASAVDPTTTRLWACFYDTIGDPSREQAWYVCSASWDGRTWSTPLRAATESSDVYTLWEDARIYNFGDVIGYGGYTSVVALSGSAQPMWIDTSDVDGNKQEIFTGRLDDPGYRH